MSFYSLYSKVLKQDRAGYNKEDMWDPMVQSMVLGNTTFTCRTKHTHSSMFIFSTGIQFLMNHTFSQSLKQSIVPKGNFSNKQLRGFLQIRRAQRAILKACNIYVGFTNSYSDVIYRGYVHLWFSFRYTFKSVHSYVYRGWIIDGHD